MIKLWQKTTWGAKNFNLQVTFCHQGKQRQKPGAETMKIHCLLDFFSWLAKLWAFFLSFFCIAQVYLPRMIWSTVYWAILHQLATKNMYHRYTNRPIWWRQFFNWGSFLCVSSWKPRLVSIEFNVGFLLLLYIVVVWQYQEIIFYWVNQQFVFLLKWLIKIHYYYW